MLKTVDFEKSRHIVLVTDNSSFANANALYTYILMLHKKVTLYTQDEIAYKFSFLPWFCKVKKIKPSSADLLLEVNAEVLEYVSFFKSNNVNINKKMATALYSALLLRYDNFTSSEVGGIVFATAKELIDLGAEHKTAQKKIARSDALALFRLRAILYKKMLLLKNTTEVELYLSDADLSASGASLEDAKKIMKEVLSLVHIKTVVLKKSDEDMKILEIYKEIEIDK